MRISVILCTYNRAQSLIKALESVAAQTLPESVEWEVLVVDNNSRDQTRDVVEDFCRLHAPRFRCVFEANQGLNYARNSGVREARGDVLAFVDDDVTVEPGWLDNLTAPLRKGEWAGSGGMTLPLGTFTPPRWLAPDGPYNMLGVLCAYFNLGDEPCELEEPPYGTNMAFRKPMFEKYGAFRTDLDRCGHDTMSNGDTEFGRRLMKAGERLRYEPSAVVWHPVPEARITKEYFLKWWFDYGRGIVREWGRKPAVLGIPRPYFNILRLGTVVIAQKIARWALSLNPQQRFYNKCRVWLTAGQIREYYRLARGTQDRAVHSIPETRASG
jgi:glycosyltransferase involved in cell wall biosynthesis